MKKEEEINNFLKVLKTQNINEEHLENKDIGTFLKHFGVCCRKCGSVNIFISWEDGTDYGGYTGYSEGQKLFKCLDCGNAYSFYS